MASFGVVHDQRVQSTNGKMLTPVVVHMLDNSCVTIAVDENTTVDQAVKQVSKRVGLSMVLSHLFGLYMSMDGSVVGQRGLADDLVLDMVDQCAKVVFAPMLMVPTLLEKNKNNKVVVRLLFSQLMHDFVMGTYRAIGYPEGIKLGAMCVFAKYGHIAEKNRTRKFLESRLFEFIPAYLLKMAKTTKETCDKVWQNYEELNTSIDRVSAMNAAIGYARSMPEVEHVWVCSNCVAPCRQQILTRLKSRCLIGIAYDGIRLFSASSSDFGVKKFYSFNSIAKWGFSQTNGNVFFEICTNYGTKVEKFDVKNVECASRCADICDTLSEYALWRKKFKKDGATAILQSNNSPRNLKKHGSYTVGAGEVQGSKLKKSMSQLSNVRDVGALEQQQQQQQHTVLKKIKSRRRASTVMVKGKSSQNNILHQKEEWGSYGLYASHVAIMLQSLWRGFKTRIAFDYMIDRIIQGMEEEGGEQGEEEEEVEQQEEEEEEEEVEDYVDEVEEKKEQTQRKRWHRLGSMKSLSSGNEEEEEEKKKKKKKDVTKSPFPLPPKKKKNFTKSPFPVPPPRKK